jgi:hypothetical protein
VSTRPTLDTLNTGAVGWNGTANDNFAKLVTTPAPPAEYANFAALPAAASYRNCVACLLDELILVWSDGATWQRIGGRAAARADSVAGTVGALVTDFNDPSWQSSAPPSSWLRKEPMTTSIYQEAVSALSALNLSVPALTVHRHVRGSQATASVPTFNIKKDVLSGGTDDQPFLTCWLNDAELTSVRKDGTVKGPALSLTTSGAAPSELAGDFGFWSDGATVFLHISGVDYDVLTDLGGGGGGGGDITDVIAGTGLTGGAASGAATLNLDVPVTIPHGGTGAVTAARSQDRARPRNRRGRPGV